MNHALLEAVCNTPGVAGYEDPVQKVVTGHLKTSCDRVHTDRMGNVIGCKTPTRKGRRKGADPVRVLLAAHADEVGMMARHIDGDGFIHINPLGGMSAVTFSSQRVLIHGKKTLQGVVVAKGGGGDKPPAVKDLRVDTGLPARKVKKLVPPGTVISFAQELVTLNDGVLMGRNFDDRLGTYCLVEAMRRVKNTTAEIYAVSTTQEEIGCRGIETAAKAILPEVGLAIDGSMPVSAVAGASDRTCVMGKGTGIYIIDKGTVGSPPLLQHLFKVARKHKIPYQENIGGNTDANKIQRTGAGCLTTTIGAPTRYMHSTVQLCHKDDLEATVQLLVHFMETAHELGGICR